MRLEGKLKYIFRLCYIGSLLLGGGCSNYHYKSPQSQSRLYPILATMPQDASVVEYYLPYKLKIDSQMNVVVAQTKSEIKRGRPEGKLNNLTADGLASVARKHNIDFDFVHLNYKTLRVPLPEGLIRTYKVFELMPFENNLVTVTLKGNDVNDLFQYMAHLGGDPISGASFRIEEGRAVDILIKGKKLEFNSTYKILTNDYFANGGDKAVMYLKALERTNHPIKQRDAFLEYLKYSTRAGKIIDPKMDGRIVSDTTIADE